MSNSSVPTPIVNLTINVPFSTKNQDNNPYETIHSSSSNDIELVLNASKNHKVKKGHGVTEDVPGITNRYG